MTKDDLMANWDQIVTDSRLTLELAERHVQTIKTDTYLFDEFHVVASGGSAGYAACSPGAGMRGRSRWRVQCGGALPTRRDHPETMTRPPELALIAAQASTHMSSAMVETFRTPGVTVHRLPVTIPMKEIVRA